MKVKLRDGSGTREYKHVWQDRDRHGNIRVYFRKRGGPITRLREEPGSEAFDKEYRRAFAGAAAPKTQLAPTGPETLHWLCRQYYGSAAFLTKLGDSTRKARRGILEAICQTPGTSGKLLIGALPYKAMEPRHVAHMRDAKAALPEAANGRVKALRALFKWAMSQEYAFAERNPAADVTYLASNNPDGFKAWTEEAVEKYGARHPVGSKARLALDLYLYTGVRRSDIVTLGPQMERGGYLVFTETKGRGRTPKRHELPILPQLRASIDATPTGHLVYLVTEFGKPHSVKAFGNWFKRRCREADVDAELSAHGLRKLAAARFAEAGATELQLMAWFGWLSPKQAALYTRNASRAKLEKAAGALLQPFPGPSAPTRSGTK